MATRTWQRNAEEFAALDAGEGWPFAILVACSVEKGTGQGARQPRRARDEVGKVSAREFSLAAGTSADRVLRYLDCWNRAADAGHVQHGDTLTPDDAETITAPDVSWLTSKGALRFGDGTATGGRPRDSKAEDAAAIIEKRGAAVVIEVMTPETKTALRRELERDATKVLNDTPETAWGKGMKSKIAALNGASQYLAIPLANMADTAEQVRDVFEEHWPNADVATRKIIVRATSDILVAMEAMRMEIGLDQFENEVDR